MSKIHTNDSDTYVAAEDNIPFESLSRTQDRIRCRFPVVKLLYRLILAAVLEVNLRIDL